MEDPQDAWGPELDQYSRHFDIELPQSNAALKTLEHVLARHNLNDGYHYGDRPLAIAISKLREYSQLDHTTGVSTDALSKIGSTKALGALDIWILPRVFACPVYSAFRLHRRAPRIKCTGRICEVAGS